MRDDKIGDKERIKHLMDAISEIESYTKGITEQEFVSNSMMRIATVKQLEIIGEVCARLSKDLKEKYAHVQWVEIISLRNILVHEYFGINFEIVWQTVDNEIPTLKKQFEQILAAQ